MLYIITKHTQTYIKKTSKLFCLREFADTKDAIIISNIYSMLPPPVRKVS